MQLLDKTPDQRHARKPENRQPNAFQMRFGQISSCIAFGISGGMSRAMLMSAIRIGGNV